MSDDDPLTPLEIGMAQLREMYVALRKGGFGRWESCIIVAAHINIPNNTDPEPGTD